MQDTKNLKRKAKEYEQKIIDYRNKDNIYLANYWTEQLVNIKDRISERIKNQKYNLKQFRKTNHQ